MNTPELLELAEIALLRAKIELKYPQSHLTRELAIKTVTRALDTMRATLTAIPVVAALVLGAGQAKAADQNAAIAKAEQKVELATCQLNFLQQRPGAKKNDREYFGFMFQCLSK